MPARILLIGTFIALAGTLVIRLAGHRLLRMDRAAQTMALYLVSFFLMAFVARRIFGLLFLDGFAWPRATTLLILPTLVLDPLSCAFFPFMFPNVDPAAAGLFGGWMLICCGGAVTGAWFRP